MLSNEDNADAINNWKAVIWKRLWSLELPFKIFIFLRKLCTNCLPMRKELRRRIAFISPLCPFCHTKEESLEHLFLHCPMTRAIWFGTDLTLRVEEIRTTSIKYWIRDWLANHALTQQDALWFYGQLVCTLWCTWLYRNEVIFNGQSANPTKVLMHQKSLLHWIGRAIKEKKHYQNCQRQLSSIQASPNPYKFL